MKRIIIMAILAMSFIAISCEGKPSDAELTTQATKVIMPYPLLSVKVENGQAHLTGIFISEQEQDAIITSLKEIEGIEQVHNKAVIEPEAVESNEGDIKALQQIQEVLKDFPSVKAEIIGGEIILSGNASSTQARRIKEYIEALEIKEYTNNIVVK